MKHIIDTHCYKKQINLWRQHRAQDLHVQIEQKEQTAINHIFSSSTASVASAMAGRTSRSASRHEQQVTPCFMLLLIDAIQLNQLVKSKYFCEKYYIKFFVRTICPSDSQNASQSSASTKVN